MPDQASVSAINKIKTGFRGGGESFPDLSITARLRREAKLVLFSFSAKRRSTTHDDVRASRYFSGRWR